MAKQDIARLTATEHRELASWARRFGSSWKRMLRERRESGRLDGPALSAFNKIGPSGLVAYRLTMAPTENPGRKTAARSAKRSAFVLTPRDREHVRETARGLLRQYDEETYDGPEIIMTSRGYVEVDVDRDDEDTAYVIENRRSHAIPMHAHRRGRSSLASRRTPNPSKRECAARKTSRRPKAKRKANGQFAKKARR